MVTSLYSRLVVSWAGLLVLAFAACKPTHKTTDRQNNRAKFGDNVRTTEFRTPDEEKAGFTLPEGFEITLFASEPDITKPINMEFDDRGRLWVTQSAEYPLPAAPGKGSDRITILEDTDGDGKADRFTPFNTRLNIPIGVLPVNDGAFAYSIPNLTYYKDTDGDGRSDEEKFVLGPFGHRDTHGMVSNLIRGFDGWIYACHGFTNTSIVAGYDGDSIKMTSGNTFRFRPDGSRVEQTTFGRVNPFGNAYDEMGNLYSVDCHSKPIYQLITGAEYPHFGKKVPAIGFAPEMMSYELGSTAISGLVYYTGLQFPEEYRHSFFNGDVVTCQINRNAVTFKGSTPVSKREADFLSSDDPWFRPVDIKVGPDGALYVADFYNRIIGHYEVALNHPGRDRVSGRIWKITYKGNKPHENIPVRDWSKATIKELLAGLAHPQLNMRMKIADRLTDAWKGEAVEPVKQLMADPSIDPKIYVQGLWILKRLNALTDNVLTAGLMSKEPAVRVHALRILMESQSLTPEYRLFVKEAISSSDANVRRVAASLLGRFPDVSGLESLITLYEKTDAEDSHLRYTTLLAIRNSLRDKKVMRDVAERQWTIDQTGVLARTMMDVSSPESASFIVSQLENSRLSADGLPEYVGYASRLVPASRLDALIPVIRGKIGQDDAMQFAAYDAINAGIAQSGGKIGWATKEWGSDLAEQNLAGIKEETEVWKITGLDRATDAGSWTIVNNLATPRKKPVPMLTGSRGAVSRISSAPFELPQGITLNVFDNDIFNSDLKTGSSRNSVRVKLTSNDKVIAEFRFNQKKIAGKEDLIKQAVLDLKKYKGQRGYIEITDSSKTAAIGIGQPASLKVQLLSVDPERLTNQRVQAAHIAGKLKLKGLEPELRSLLNAKWANYKLRSAAAEALLQIAAEDNSPVLVKVVADRSESSAFRQKIVATLGQSPSEAVYSQFEKELSGAARPLQVALASALSNDEEGISHLLNALQQDQVGADILAETSVSEKLAAKASAKQQKQLSEIASGGATERAERLALIQNRLNGLDLAKVSSNAGKEIFMNNCSMCHQIRGNGGLVGPQLDGIGNWGQKALTEKILDPNRSISEAFRSYNIVLKNGQSLTGLFRRTEGELIVFANPDGKEFSVAKTDMKEYKASKYTLMPDQFRYTIPEKEFYALVTYLLTVK